MAMTGTEEEGEEAERREGGIAAGRSPALIVALGVVSGNGTSEESYNHIGFPKER